MYKKFALITLLMFGLGALPSHASDAGTKILLAESGDDASKTDNPKDKAPDSNADEKKKDEKKKTGEKKSGGEEPNCE
jgi:Sec-independent protein translocase protein TatA